MQLLANGVDTKVNALVEQVMGSDTQLRGSVRWGMWTYGASSPAAVLRAIGPYTLEGYAPLITCPTLVLDGENDLFFLGQPSQLYEALRCQKTYHLFPAAEGRRRTLPGGDDVQAAPSGLRLA